MQNLLDDLLEVLKNDERLVIDGKLAKNKIIELSLSVDSDLLKLLLQSDSLRTHFFRNIDGVIVFDKIDFQKFVSNKQFLSDSYTAFKNKIGLTLNGEYLTEAEEVVLAWPYKDCVLEGGQTKDDQKRKEIFWNTTLASDEIDRLLSPKVMTNFKYYGDGKKKKSQHIQFEDNLVIKGNNLLALYSLREIYKGQIKLIYIDPPYNTGGGDFGYNDSFNHSAWLTFMKNRLEVALELLSSEGSIWINIDDNESHYLKVLCDGIFQRENFVANVVWEKADSPRMDAHTFSSRHDHILVYAKNIHRVNIKRVANNPEKLTHYNRVDDKGKAYYLKPLRAMGKDGTREARPSMYFPITAPDKTKIYPKNKDGSDSRWRWSPERVAKEKKRLEFLKTKNGWSIYFKIFAEENSVKPPETIWYNKEVGSNRTSKAEIKKLFNGSVPFDTPKPERLIQRIIEIASNERDIVLDFYSGSGTTGAVAMKLNRQFICIEQMDYIESVTIERLRKVIEGEDGGISKAVKWKGGGSFYFAELLKSNAIFLDEIENVQSKKILAKVFEKMKASGFLSYQVDITHIKDQMTLFNELSLDQQKQVLVELLDKNMLYVNYSEIDNKDYAVSEKDKALNKRLYSKL